MSVLSEEEIAKKLVSMPLWRIENGKLCRSFEAKSFSAAMTFIVTIGTIADHAHHHPDIHLTNYKNIEIVLFTPRLNGITDMDFEMAAHFDQVPVSYSLVWAHKHPDLVKTDASILPPTTLGSPGSSPRITKYDTLFRQPARQLHSPERPVLVTGGDFPGSIHGRESHAHSPHKHPFLVHTGSFTRTGLGHSDIVRQVDHQTPRYETETMHMMTHDSHHATSQSSSEAPAPPPFPQHLQHHVEALPGRNIALHKKHPGNFECEEDYIAWEEMSSALQTLIDQGYDVGMSSSILPMVNAHEVYPDWEENMHDAYVHLKKRLTPSWAIDEPADVLSACRKFVDGYNVVFNERPEQIVMG